MKSTERSGYSSYRSYTGRVTVIIKVRLLHIRVKWVNKVRLSTEKEDQIDLLITGKSIYTPKGGIVGKLRPLDASVDGVYNGPRFQSKY